jgi:hypothetical protein
VSVHRRFTIRPDSDIPSKIPENRPGFPFPGFPNWLTHSRVPPTPPAAAAAAAVLAALVFLRFRQNIPVEKLSGEFENHGLSQMGFCQTYPRLPVRIGQDLNSNWQSALPKVDSQKPIYPGP